jgi:hypothetical protein
MKPYFALRTHQKQQTQRQRGMMGSKMPSVLILGVRLRGYSSRGANLLARRLTFSPSAYALLETIVYLDWYFRLILELSPSVQTMIDPLSIAGLIISIFDQFLKLGERMAQLIADAKTFDYVRLPDFQFSPPQVCWDIHPFVPCLARVRSIEYWTDLCRTLLIYLGLGHRR